MPNQHAPDKEILGFYIPRTLSKRVRKAAQAEQSTICALVERVLEDATKEIELSPEELEEIERRTAEVANRRLQTRNRKARKAGGGKGNHGGKAG